MISLNNPPGKPYTSLLHGQQVRLGEAVQIKGDKERREQVEHSLEVMIREKLQDAEQKVQAMLAQASQQAQEIIEEAEKQAQALVQEGQAQCEAIQNKAYIQGYEDGVEKGHAEAMAEVESETVSLLMGAQTMVEGALQAKQRVLQSFQQQALQLVIYVAQKVLHQELNASPEKLMTLIEEAVQALYLNGKIQVVVSAETLASIRQFSQTTEQALERMNRFEWVGDPKLTLDQVYVITEEARFELTPSVQAAQLLEPLAGQLPLSAENESDLEQAEEVADWREKEEAVISEDPFEGLLDDPPDVSSPEFISLEDLVFETVDENENNENEEGEAPLTEEEPRS